MGQGTGPATFSWLRHWFGGYFFYFFPVQISIEFQKQKTRFSLIYHTRATGIIARISAKFQIQTAHRNRAYTLNNFHRAALQANITAKSPPTEIQPRSQCFFVFP